jgi:putative PEP-CTERM system TPR-repeat lipoprotein
MTMKRPHKPGAATFPATATARPALDGARRSLRLRLAVAAAATALVTLSACAGKDSPDALLDKARQSLASNEPRAAEIHLKNLLQQTDNSEARFLLGKVYQDAGDLVSAEKEYRRALDNGYSRDQTLPRLMKVLLELGELQKVLDLSHDMRLEAAPAKAEALAMAGHALMRLGKTDEARRTFDDAVAADPANVTAQVGAATLLARTDRPGARALVDEVLRKQPDAVDALALRADLEIADRRIDDARATLRDVVKRSPRNADAHAKLVSLALEQQDFDAARKHQGDLAKLAPQSGATLYLKAVVEARTGNTAQARDAIIETLERSPNYLPALALAGGLHLQLGELEQAERRGRQLVDRAPNATAGYRVLGATYLRMNAPDRALEAVRRPLENGAKDSMLYAIAGEASLKQNDAEGAARYFEEAAKLDPEDARKLTGLALSRLASGDRQRAIEELETAVELESSTPQAEMALVMALTRDKKFDQALEQVERMEGKMGSNPLPPTLRGSVLAARGDIAGARSALEEALKRDPSYFAAANNLAVFDMREGKPEAARKRFEGVIAADPKQVQAHVALAQYVARTGARREEVLELLRKARAANPSAVLPVVATGRYMLETNTPGEAVPMLQQALNANPDSLQILDILASSLMASGQRTQAISTWERLLRLNPTNWRAVMRIGEAQRVEGQQQAALASYRKAADIAPNELEPKIAVAGTLHAMGRKDEARQLAKQLQSSKEHALAGVVLQGDIEAADQNWGPAIEAYRKAFKQQASMPVGAKLHRALRAAGREADADAMLAAWVKAEPKNLELRVMAGEWEIARKRWQAAYGHYEVILESQPKNVLALNNAAWALNELEDDRALDLARRAWEAAPKSASVLDTYGLILAERGDPKGIELLRQAVATAPDLAPIRLHLAEALVRAGDPTGARAEIETVLKSTPEGSPVADQAKALQAKL